MGSHARALNVAQAQLTARTASPKSHAPPWPPHYRPDPANAHAVRSAAARQRAGAAAGVQIAYETYGELAADKGNAILIFHALTGEQFVASNQSLHRQTGLVGTDGRPRPADRYSALFQSSAPISSAGARVRPARQRCGRTARLMAWAFPSSPSATWCARRWRCSIAGDRPAACGHRRIDGRNAGAQPCRQLARAGRTRAGDCHHRAPFGPEHRLSRGRAAGDHGRS